MNTTKTFPVLILIMAIISCNNNTELSSNPEDQRMAEFQKLDSLIRSESFSYEMARALDSAYAATNNLPRAEFLSPGEDTANIKKTVGEEKLATNLSGFYALECGVGLLSDRTRKKPTEILSEIVGNKLDSSSIDLLNRFANATWKAAQPFRDLKRITRPTFRVFNLLPPDEVKKDYDQIRSAASKLLFSMQDISGSSAEAQMERIRSLLQSEKYANEMAAFLDSAYYANNSKPAVPFTAPGDTAVIHKSARDQKIATNVAGMYALDCGIVYLATQTMQLPSTLLRMVTENKMSKEDMMLLARFANATWKSGQPFRGLTRITRETFTPFYFLTEADIEKDLVQIRSAAAVLLKAMEN